MFITDNDRQDLSYGAGILFVSKSGVFAAVLREKTPYDNPNYKASLIIAGRDLRINANNVYNEISKIFQVCAICT